MVNMIVAFLIGCAIGGAAVYILIDQSVIKKVK
jgi:hypothetical protein